MNWYITKLVYQIICGSGNHTPQFDEQLRLVAATDVIEAFAKAQHMGVNEEEMFCNHKQELVQWKFVNVAELYCINQLVDGAELYSRINDVDDAAHYVETVHKKAAAIQENSSPCLLH